MIYNHRRRPGHPGAVPEDARDELQAAGGEGGGAAVDHLPDPGEELVAGLGEVAADDDGPGLSRLTVEASTCPMRRPASRTAWMASRPPALTSATTAWVSAASSRCAKARPPATDSRHPVLPQRHTIPSAAATWTCPMSPAAPAPRWSLPPRISPDPIPFPP